MKRLWCVILGAVTLANLAPATGFFFGTEPPRRSQDRVGNVAHGRPWRHPAADPHRRGHVTYYRPRPEHDRHALRRYERPVHSGRRPVPASFTGRRPHHQGHHPATERYAVQEHYPARYPAQYPAQYPTPEHGQVERISFGAPFTQRPILRPPVSTAPASRPPLETTAGGRPPLETTAGGRPPLETAPVGQPSLDRRVIEVTPAASANAVREEEPETPAKVFTTSGVDPASSTYMKNTELLVKIATHFDTKGCFRRLVCECEYYNTGDSTSLTVEEKLILHVFGMKRRRKVGDADQSRFLMAAAIGEAARRNGLPDPCPPLAPKCTENMVMKLRARRNHKE